MDPLILVVAKTLFAGISAAAAAVQAWYTHRDAKKAAAEFDATYAKTLASPEAQKAAEQLTGIIPGSVVKELEARADSCWTSYRNVLGGDFLPDEIDKATESVQACVCRELLRLKTLNGSIPPRWKKQWELYNCESRGKGAGRARAGGTSTHGGNPVSRPVETPRPEPA